MDSSNIREARHSKNITQQELSEASGISLRTIQRIEKQEAIPRAYTLRKINEVLGIKVQTESLGQSNKLQIYLLIQWSSLVFPFLFGFISYLFWKRNQWSESHNVALAQLVSFAIYATFLFPILILISMIFIRNFNFPVSIGFLPTPLVIYWLLSLVYSVISTYFVTEIKKGSANKLSVIPSIL